MPAVTQTQLVALETSEEMHHRRPLDTEYLAVRCDIVTEPPKNARLTQS